MINKDDLIVWLDSQVNCSNRTCTKCHALFDITDCPIGIERYSNAAKELLEYLQGTPPFIDEIRPDDIMAVLNG